MKQLGSALALLLVPALTFASDSGCPVGIGAAHGEAPQVSARVAGITLLVCGQADDSPVEGEGKHLVEFDVYSVTQKGSPSPPLKTASALDHYLVQKTNQGLRFDELIFQNQKWLPAFRSELTCKSESCSFSKESCVFKAKKAGSAEALKTLQSYISGKKKGQVPDEVLIVRVSDLALAGNKKAQAIFLKQDDKLMLDGASGEEFHRTRKTLQRMKDLRCI